MIGLPRSTYLLRSVVPPVPRESDITPDEYERAVHPTPKTVK